MSYSSRRRPTRAPERRRRGNGCLTTLVVLVWLVLLGLIVYQFWLRPRVSQYIGEQIAQQVGDEARSEAERQQEQQVQEQVGTAIPGVVSALPSGEVRITEGQANEYLLANAGNLRPIDTIQVRFVPDQVQADITAFGQKSTATLGLAVQNGRIIALDPQIDGVLGQVVSATDLAKALETQFNNQLSAQNRRVTDVRIEQGALVLTVDG